MSECWGVKQLCSQEILLYLLSDSSEIMGTNTTERWHNYWRPTNPDGPPNATPSNMFIQHAGAPEHWEDKLFVTSKVALWTLNHCQQVLLSLVELLSAWRRTNQILRYCDVWIRDFLDSVCACVYVCVSEQTEQQVWGQCDTAVVKSFSSKSSTMLSFGLS